MIRVDKTMKKAVKHSILVLKEWFCKSKNAKNALLMYSTGCGASCNAAESSCIFQSLPDRPRFSYLNNDKVPHI